MPLKRNTTLMLLLLCSLALWCKSASAGSSFLSPSQKPQNKAKSPRVNRQAMGEFDQPNEGNHITISAPFEIGITMNKEDFEEYGAVLQKVLQRLLGDAPTAGEPSER